MRIVNMKFLVEQAMDERQEDPFAIAVRASIELDSLVPSILRTKLAEAGFEVVDDELEHLKDGFRTFVYLDRVLIKREGVIVAMGAAGNVSEALAHAVLGWFREHPLPDSEVPAGIATLPT